MYEVGFTSNGRTDTALFEECEKNNIKHIELSEWKHDAYESYDFKRLSKITKEHGVNIWSLHLPFGYFEDVEISSLDKELRKRSIEIFERTIQKGADIGIDKFVVHPSGEPIDDADRPERLKYSKESLSKLVDIAEKNGAVICVEDLPRTCLGHSIEEMKLLTESDGRLRICLDTNHVTLEKPEELIRALGDKIATVHISDYDFVDEKHWLPGEGKIDWKKVMSALKDIDYKGAFVYEISFACPQTIKRRDLTLADFRRNADELFSGKPLTVISEQQN